jgi:hypothetical protein
VLARGAGTSRDRSHLLACLAGEPWRHSDTRAGEMPSKPRLSAVPRPSHTAALHHGLCARGSHTSVKALRSLAQDEGQVHLDEFSVQSSDAVARGGIDGGEKAADEHLAIVLKHDVAHAAI